MNLIPIFLIGRLRSQVDSVISCTYLEVTRYPVLLWLAAYHLANTCRDPSLISVYALSPVQGTTRPTFVTSTSTTELHNLQEVKVHRLQNVCGFTHQQYLRSARHAPFQGNLSENYSSTMKVWSWIRILTGCVLLSSTIHAKKPDCYPWNHPKYKCGDPITCQSDWPSETGNYANVTTRQYAFHQQLSLLSKDYRRARRQEQNTTCKDSDCQPLQPLPFAKAPTSESQCCMPTVECHRHFSTAAVDKKGYFIHLEDFKKFICCWYDFILPKPLCPYPPGPDVVLRWSEPPSCSNWDGVSNILTLSLLGK